MPSPRTFVLGRLVATDLPDLGLDVAEVAGFAEDLVDIVVRSDGDDIPSQVAVDARVLGAVDVEELYGDFDDGVRTWE